MDRIVIAGCGAVGASIAYHLALKGARDVTLADRAEIASGATGKAMGGVRQQFSTEAEVRLARESVRFFQELGRPLFEQVGYLFVATTDDGAERLRERMAAQRELGVPVEDVDPSRVEGLYVEDVAAAGACWEDGVAEPAEITRELVRRATAGGVEVRERTDAREVETDVLVVAAGASSPELWPQLPIRPLCRQLVDDWRARLAHRYPPAAGTPVHRAWAGLYDMTPDAHPIIGWVGDGVYAACGFSGHGFMQSPAVGRAVAEELIHGESELDLSPYRLDRFSGEAVFPETLVL